jgi:putative ABC transport system ATP-binding protein
LVTEPSLILADEPTGNLDSAAGAEVIKLLKELNDEGQDDHPDHHDASIAAQAQRQIHLRDGPAGDRRLTASVAMGIASSADWRSAGWAPTGCVPS